MTFWEFGQYYIAWTGAMWLFWTGIGVLLELARPPK